MGLKAGAVLRKIHSLPAPDVAEPWGARFRRKVQARIDLYHEHNLQSESGDLIIKYLHDKESLLDSRPQTFWHGDFNAGNHMITPEGEIAVFDFNHWNLLWRPLVGICTGGVGRRAIRALLYRDDQRIF